MQNLTRRTALAAVPLLAAVPAFAGQNLGALQGLKVSPHIAALVAEYHQCKADRDRLSDKVNEQHSVIKASGLVDPIDYTVTTGKTRKLDREWADDVTQYKARYEAQPEVIRLKEFREAEDRVWDRWEDLAHEITEMRAETFADLQAQFDIWFDYFVEWNVDGSPAGVANMGGPELRFLLRVPGEIRRLTGAS